MNDVNTAVAEPSPAAVITPPAEPVAAPKSKNFDMPRSGPERDAFLKSGTMPGEPKADSTPAEKSPDTGSDSGTDKIKQEAKGKPLANAETRLPELLSERKQLLARIKELETAPKPASEPTPPPSKAAEAPKPPEYAKPKPQLKDFDDVEKYTDALTDWKIEKSDFERAQRERSAKLDADVRAMRAKAEERYGPEYEAPLRHAAETIFTKDAGAIPGVVKAMINDSDVLPDLLYTLGTDEKGLQDFAKLARDNPSQAIRKLVLLENGIREELAKPKAPEATGATARGEDGKFVAAQEPPPAPAKKTTQTPPPPREASGTAAAPPDELAAAYERGDFTTIQRIENARDVANRARRR